MWQATCSHGTQANLQQAWVSMQMELLPYFKVGWEQTRQE